MRQSLMEKLEKEFPPEQFGLTFAIGKFDIHEKPNLL